MKRILDKIKNNFVARYFKELGEELKEYVLDNWHQLLFLLGAIVLIGFFFMFPKIMLLIFAACIAISIAGVITVMIWLDWQTMQATPDYKYPHLSTLVHLGGWLFFIGFIVWACILIILEMYKSLFN